MATEEQTIASSNAEALRRLDLVLACLPDQQTFTEEGVPNTSWLQFHQDFMGVHALLKPSLRTELGCQWNAAINSTWPDLAEPQLTDDQRQALQEWFIFQRFQQLSTPSISRAEPFESSELVPFQGSPTFSGPPQNGPNEPIAEFQGGGSGEELPFLGVLASPTFETPLTGSPSDAEVQSQKESVFAALRLDKMTAQDTSVLPWSRPWWAPGNLTLPFALGEVALLVVAVILLGIGQFIPGGILLGLDVLAVAATCTANLCASSAEKHFYAEQRQQKKARVERWVNNSRDAWRDLTTQSGIDPNKLGGFGQLFMAYHYRQQIRTELNLTSEQMSHPHFPDDLIALVEGNPQQYLPTIQRIGEANQSRPLTAMVKVLVFLSLPQASQPSAAAVQTDATAVDIDMAQRVATPTALGNLPADQLFNKLISLVDQTEQRVQDVQQVRRCLTSDQQGPHVWTDTQVDQAFWALFLEAARELDPNKKSWVWASEQATGVKKFWPQATVDAACTYAKTLPDVTLEWDRPEGQSATGQPTRVRVDVPTNMPPLQGFNVILGSRRSQQSSAGSPSKSFRDFLATPGGSSLSAASSTVLNRPTPVRLLGLAS